MWLGNTAPVAHAGGPYDLPNGQALVLDGSGSWDWDEQYTLGHKIALYEWDLDYDGDYDQSSSSDTATVAFSTLETLHGPLSVNDVFVVGLRVTDSMGATGTDAATVTVIPEPSSALLTAVGLVGLLAAHWRRRR